MVFCRPVDIFQLQSDRTRVQPPLLVFTRVCNSRHIASFASGKPLQAAPMTNNGPPGIGGCLRRSGYPPWSRKISVRSVLHRSLTVLLLALATLAASRAIPSVTASIATTHYWTGDGEAVGLAGLLDVFEDCFEPLCDGSRMFTKFGSSLTSSPSKFTSTSS